MKSVLRIATVDPNDESRGSLKNLLLGIDMVWLEAECSRFEFFLDIVKQTQPDIALVSLDTDPEKGLSLISEIKREAPACCVLCVSSSEEGSLILRAMRNGANEFLKFPMSLDEFMGALDRIRSTFSGGGEGEVQSSKIVTVAGVSGGVGSTSLAINLGCILAQEPRNSVVILDLDLTLGDADVWLDIIPDYTIQDVADNIARLDFSLLKRSLTKHECGVFLLPRPVQIEESPTIAPDELRRFVALLKATFTHVIIDVSKSLGTLDMAAIEMSDIVLLIAQLDLSSLRNVVRLMQLLERKEMPDEKTRIIINRTGMADSEISLSKALETIGREVYWQLPNDYASMVEACNTGVPLCISAPKAKLTRSLEALVQSFEVASENKASAEENRKRKRLFSFMGNK